MTPSETILSPLGLSLDDAHVWSWADTAKCLRRTLAYLDEQAAAQPVASAQLAGLDPRPRCGSRHDGGWHCELVPGHLGSHAAGECAENHPERFDLHPAPAPPPTEDNPAFIPEAEPALVCKKCRGPVETAAGGLWRCLAGCTEDKPKSALTEMRTRIREERDHYREKLFEAQAELTRVKTEQSGHLARLVAGDPEAMRQQSIDELEAVMARAYERCERERDEALVEITRIKEENARLSEDRRVLKQSETVYDTELRKRDAVVGAAREAFKWFMCDDRCLTSSAITIMLDRALSELNRPVRDPAVPVIESGS